MPEDVRVLEAALEGPVDVKALGKRLKLDEDGVLGLLTRMKNALKIVDAQTPAAGFREGVRQSIEHAVKQGLDDPKAITDLVGQICYRAADLSFLLKERNETLHQYSEELRREPD
jgi:hypothetical protein